MQKIANAQELQTELTSILEYAQTPNPSREKLAAALISLSSRVASPMSGVNMEDLKNAWKAGQKSGDAPEEAKGELDRMVGELQENVKTLARHAGKSLPIAPNGMPVGVFSGIGGNLWEIAYWMGVLSTNK